jgi:phosphoglycerate dehydrogenase-like enzyme
VCAAVLLTADTSSAVRRMLPHLPQVVVGSDGVTGDLSAVRYALFPETSRIVAVRLAEALQLCRALEWVHVGHVGVEHPLFRGLLERGARLTTTRGANSHLIAQTAVLHVLAHSRRLEAWKDAQRRRAWEPHDVDDLTGQVLGVLGLGSIGARVADFGLALGMRVVGIRRRPRGDEPWEVWSLDRVDELVAIVDYLVLAAPVTDATRGVLDAERIGRLKPTAYVVNVARGALVDEWALVDALQEGRLGGAALDVFDVEPLPADSPLWSLPNVTVTPHAAGRHPVKQQRALELFAANLRRLERGEPMLNEVEVED